MMEWRVSLESLEQLNIFDWVILPKEADPEVTCSVQPAAGDLVSWVLAFQLYFSPLVLLYFLFLPVGRSRSSSRPESASPRGFFPSDDFVLIAVALC